MIDAGGDGGQCGVPTDARFWMPGDPAELARAGWTREGRAAIRDGWLKAKWAGQGLWPEGASPAETATDAPNHPAPNSAALAFPERSRSATPGASSPEIPARRSRR
jgi:hypothetical protein